MTHVGGTYAVVTKTPLGEQRGTFVVDDHEPGCFTGYVENPTGSMQVIDGRVEDNRLTWKMEMTAPMKMMLQCEATLVDDTLDGTIRAGAFGKMALSGIRVG